MSSSSKTTTSKTRGNGRAPGTGRRAGADKTYAGAGADATSGIGADHDSLTLNRAVACVNRTASADADDEVSHTEDRLGDNRIDSLLISADAAINRAGASNNDMVQDDNDVTKSDTISAAGREKCVGLELPEFTPLAEPNFTWGCNDGRTFCESINAAYNEAVHWRRNIFKVPSGKAGKEFTLELARLFRSYGQASSLECIAIKAAMLMPVLLLQKPSRTSKAKDHVQHLERRLKAWLEGDIAGLVHEGRVIRNHIVHTQRRYEDDDQLARTFAKFMVEGKTHAAMRLLSDSGRNSILPLDSLVDGPSSRTVRDELKAKHPAACPASESALLTSSNRTVPTHPVLFDSITASSIKASALRCQGSAGPSGMNSAGWQRLCCSFKGASADLCTALALVARRLATEHVDPAGLSALVASRLIALDKCPGVRPIGVGEVSRRIIAKAILQVVGNDVREVTGAQQLCAGQPAGAEAAVHAITELFTNAASQGVLLVDAANAFNNINRQVALHNIHKLCPSIATILTNTYRQPSDLFIDGEVLYSEEGTTQGDPLAMAFYALATVPLANQCAVNNLREVWLADDASASGQLRSLLEWWTKLSTIGPSYGYFPNAAKTWLVVHPVHLEEARLLFVNTGVQISTDGRRELGAPLGSSSFVENYVSEKVKTWLSELDCLCTVARSQPQAAYCAFCQGLRSKWLYLSRTVPDIGPLLQPLEDKIRQCFIPAITGQAAPNNIIRDLLALPGRLGGLSLSDPVAQADVEYNASTQLTAPLVALIVVRERSPGECFEHQKLIKTEIRRFKRKLQDDKAKAFMEILPDDLKRCVHLAQEKGASSWLTVRPLQEHGFTLHKSAFHDALSLRYGWPLKHLPDQCVCGHDLTADHAMSCPTGGLPSLRHNEIRDLLGALLSEVCVNTSIEPVLQTLTGEQFQRRTTTTDDDARLDIFTRGFWSGRSEDAFFDVRVINPNAPSYRNLELSACYRRAEKEKERKYGERVRQVEHASFTPLIFATTGGVSKLTDVFLKRLASHLADKRDVQYSVTMSWLRCRLSFSLLRSAVLCMRGSRRSVKSGIRSEDLDPVLAAHQASV